MLWSFKIYNYECPYARFLKSFHKFFITKAQILQIQSISYISYPKIFFFQWCSYWLKKHSIWKTFLERNLYKTSKAPTFKISIETECDLALSGINESFFSFIITNYWPKILMIGFNIVAHKSCICFSPIILCSYLYCSLLKIFY